MADKGRCVGCGKVGPVKPMLRHVLACAAYASAYRADPAGTQGPGEAFAQWSASGAAEQERAAADAEAWRKREVAHDAHRRAEQQRWAGAATSQSPEPSDGA